MALRCRQSVNVCRACVCTKDFACYLLAGMSGYFNVYALLTGLKARYDRNDQSERRGLADLGEARAVYSD